MPVLVTGDEKFVRKVGVTSRAHAFRGGLCHPGRISDISMGNVSFARVGGCFGYQGDNMTISHDQVKSCGENPDKS